MRLLYASVLLAASLPVSGQRYNITTIAGTGEWGYNGDGQPATAFKLFEPFDVAVDPVGNVYIADAANHRIRKLTPGGSISTIAGNGLCGPLGDNGPAALAAVCFPMGLAFDRAGNLYIATPGDNRVRKISPGGTISTVAGTGSPGYTGDGGPATSGRLNWPSAVVLDPAGTLFIADSSNNRVRRVAPDGTITTFAGNGRQEYSGDGGPAATAGIYYPVGLALDSNGNLYISDSYNERIRKVTPGGLISTVAGNGGLGSGGDGGLATATPLSSTGGIDTDSFGNILFAETFAHKIRRVTPGGLIFTIAGTGASGFSGDGGLATSAMLNLPRGLKADAYGNIFFPDENNNRVRKLTPIATISLDPTSVTLSAPAGGGSFAVNVSPSDYQWSAHGNADWIVPYKTSGTGSGTVQFGVSANTSLTARTGTITVEWLTFTVTQLGAGAPVALRFVPVAPCRIIDTRDGQVPIGPFGPPAMTAGSTRDFPLPTSPCGIPSTALAYSINATVVPFGPLSYMTLWPTGQGKPLVSTLNSFDGSVAANAAIVPAGSAGSISAFVTDRTHLIIDINGYFAPPGQGDPLAFFTLAPCRVVDTRTSERPPGAFGPPAITGNTSRDFPLPTGGCGLPQSARAWSLNATVVPRGPLGYLTLWPTGMPQPFVSTLNSFDGNVVANAAIVPAGVNGVSAFASNLTDLILDVNGYFASQTGPSALSFIPVTPCRIADTRASSGFSGPFGPPTLGAGAARDVPISSSSCNIPAIARAYSVNITVVPQGSLAYLTVWPAGQARPLVSTLNSFDGSVIANAAIVPAGTNGAISVFAAGTTDVIIDINGYFAP